MGFFDRLKKGLSKSRGNLTERVDELVENTTVVDDDFYDELTDILLLSDVGVKASTEIIDELRERLEEGKIRDAAAAKQVFKDLLTEEMNIPRPPLSWPMVMFVVLSVQLRMTSLLSGPSAPMYRLSSISQGAIPPPLFSMQCRLPKRVKPIC